MMSLSIFLSNVFTEGGTLMMSLILICLVISILFLVKGFITSKTDAAQSIKMRKMAGESSLLGLVIGFFASILGLISAFDTVESMGNPDPSLFAAGLKVSLLTATFGLFSFVLVRVGILILRGLHSK
ncbi:MotA/TolQ/ExbB proton channel family protein [Aurantibacter sp.]|uniref:MotA/TolQ/ExbB proton channel family protein n=1 Tax=Aurantibacter sp. TaxID=2807103 RepID=UPI0035C802D0